MQVKVECLSIRNTAKKIPSFYSQITPSLCQVQWDQCVVALKMKRSLSSFASCLPSRFCLHLTCHADGGVKHIQARCSDSSAKEGKKKKILNLLAALACGQFVLLQSAGL